jgi:hypothetical protein
MNGGRMAARLFAGTVVSLAVGVLAGAGVASASEDDYINDLNNSSIFGPRTDQLQLGYQACVDKNQGVPRNKSIDNIRGSTKLNAGQAEFLYTSALKYLCGS